MKIVYLAFAGTDQSGVHRKLAEQVHAMRAHGADVHAVVCVDTRHGPAPEHAPYAVLDLAGGGFDATSRALAFEHMRAVIAAQAPDVVYVRYPVYDPHVLKLVQNSPPVVFELQTIYANEVPAAAAAYEAQWATQVLPKTAGLVAVTGEILAAETARAGWAIPGHVMPNGADPATIPFTAPALASDRIDVLCVASFYPWHGVDRLIVGLAAEPDVQDVHVHLVGDGPTIPMLKTLSDEAGVASRVHFHGAVPVRDLDAWYARAHVAVGSLAPHRVGLRELAALKHREYVLRGLPMILAGGDADFPAALPWYRQVVSDDSPVSPRMIRSLANGWTNVARRRQIRQWAESHVSWHAKVPALLAFLHDCAQRDRGQRARSVA